jgi:hypothetical protein
MELPKPPLRLALGSQITRYIALAGMWQAVVEEQIYTTLK